MSSLNQREIDEMRLERSRGWNEDWRYNYSLNSGSTVWDVGGWFGEFTRNIVTKFDCSVDVFEILPRVSVNLRDWFAQYPKVTVHPYGLGPFTSTLRIRDASECTSALVTGTYEVPIRDVNEELASSVIDLMKINIEGGEYALISAMLDSGKINLVNNLQVQFHDYVILEGIYIEVPDAQQRYDEVVHGLAETHDLMWRVPWVWESWRRR